MYQNAAVHVPFPSEFRLITVLRGSLTPSDGKQFTARWVQDTIKEYEQQDDVFHIAFLETVFFHGSEELTNEARDYLTKLGNKQVVFISPTQRLDLLPGPYAQFGHELRDVWKLATDINGVSMVTLEPNLK